MSEAGQGQSGGKGWIAVALIAVSASLGGCKQIAEGNPGACGNGIVEPALGEACDTAAPAGSRCGEPSSVRACRFVCGPTAQASSCPEGSCGVDGICRVATGNYEMGVALDLDDAAEPVNAIGRGDFDGNGQADLVFESLGRVLRFFPDGQGAGLVDRSTGRRFRVAEVDGDPGEDLVFVSPGARPDRIAEGVSLLVGSPTKNRLFGVASLTETLEPGAQLFSGRPGRADQGALRDELLAVHANQISMLSSDTEGPAMQVVVELPFDSSRLAQPPVAVELARWSCPWRFLGESDEVVLLEEQATQVTLATLCAPGSDPAPVRTSTGGVIERAHVGDVDGDGAADLLLSEAEGVYLAYGRGDGSFHSTSDRSSPADQTAALWLQVDSTFGVRAVSDVNLDGRVDIFFGVQLGLVSTDGPARPCPGNDTFFRVLPAGYECFEANVAEGAAFYDLNGDGRLDSVAQRVGAITVEYSVGTLSARRVSSQYPILAFGLVNILGGEVNADISMDLVGAFESGAGNELRALYGSQGGTFQLGEAFAKTGTVRQVLGYQGDFGRYASLVGDPGADGWSLHYFTNLRADALQATSNSSTLAPGLAVGRFRGRGRHEVAVVDHDLSEPVGFVRLLEIEPGGALGSNEFPLQKPRRALPAGDWAQGLSLAVDVDNDAIDELVLISGDGRLLVLRADVTADQPIFFEHHQQLDLGVEILSGDSAVGIVADVEADGDADLVVVGADSLLVLLNDGSGFSSSPPRLTPLENVRALDYLDHDGDGVPELLALTPDGLFLSYWDAEASAFGQITQLPAAGGGNDFTFADLNNDGLDDLVLATDDGIVVHHAIERFPGG